VASCGELATCTVGLTSEQFDEEFTTSRHVADQDTVEFSILIHCNFTKHPIYLFGHFGQLSFVQPSPPHCRVTELSHRELGLTLLRYIVVQISTAYEHRLQLSTISFRTVIFVTKVKLPTELFRMNAGSVSVRVCRGYKQITEHKAVIYTV